MAKKQINLLEIDAQTGTFRIYGIPQPHHPSRLKVEITQLVGKKMRKRVIRNMIQRLVVYVESS